jgi:hypothetical protein
MPGPYDFAVRINAARLGASLDRSRVRLALRSQACTTSPRPPHPTPNVRDDREPPLFSGWDGENKLQISEKQKRIIFRERAGQEFATAARRANHLVKKIAEEAAAQPLSYPSPKRSVAAQGGEGGEGGIGGLRPPYLIRTPMLCIGYGAGWGGYTHSAIWVTPHRHIVRRALDVPPSPRVPRGRDKKQHAITRPSSPSAHPRSRNWRRRSARRRVR